MLKDDTYFMKQALREAQKSYEQDEVPVGCVIVVGNEVIAKAHNVRQSNHDVLGHAEIKAIQKATKKQNAWVLEDATLYVTLEPCLMCAGAILQSRIKRVVYGAFEPKFGVLGSVMDVFHQSSFNHQVQVTSGILKEESAHLLQQFFREKRQEQKNKPIE